jgi:hypothetical protein
MSTYYLRVETHNRTRKILIDMAYLAKHNIIRLLKFYYEEGLYLPYKSDGNSTTEKYELTKDKIIKEDDDHYFFKFPFKYEQIEGVAV